MAADEPLEAQLENLQHSDQRAIRSVDSLTGDAWHAPSVLPGWTRSHVVAHLALNAEGFVRALGGLQAAKDAAVYDSNDARDADIEALADSDPAEIRERYFAATADLRRAFGSLTAEQWSLSVNRLPDGPAWPAWPAASLPAARRMEVEVHHADLGADYAPGDWPADFCARLLDLLARNHADSPASDAFAVRATDLRRTWEVGAAEPLVSGTAGELAWWLIGRPPSSTLTEGVHGPTLPTVGPWTRVTPTRQ